MPDTLSNTCAPPARAKPAEREAKGRWWRLLRGFCGGRNGGVGRPQKPQRTLVFFEMP